MTKGQDCALELTDCQLRWDKRPRILVDVHGYYLYHVLKKMGLNDHEDPQFHGSEQPPRRVSQCLVFT